MCCAGKTHPTIGRTGDGSSMGSPKGAQHPLSTLWVPCDPSSPVRWRTLWPWAVDGG